MTIKQTIDEAFPQVTPGFTPLGARVLVQLKTTKKTSSGGIVLVEETKSTEQFNTQIAKIIKLGTSLHWQSYPRLLANHAKYPHYAYTHQM